MTMDKFLEHLIIIVGKSAQQIHGRNNHHSSVFGAGARRTSVAPCHNVPVVHLGIKGVVNPKRLIILIHAVYFKLGARKNGSRRDKAITQTSCAVHAYQRIYPVI